MAQGLLKRGRRRLVRLMLELTDPVLYSRPYVRTFERRRRFPGEERRISVAIPHYERADLIHVALKNVFGDERVSEIIVLDDGSCTETIDKCIQVLRPFRSKVRLFRRPLNRGVMATKIQAAELCSNAWGIILDSDNTVFPGYLDSIFDGGPWDDETIYCAGYAFPRQDFREYGNLTLDFEAACALKRNDHHRRFMGLISRGNGFLNVARYAQVMRPYRDCRAFADSALTNYIWLSHGYRLRVLRDATYYHRVHSGSHWAQNREASLAKLRLINERFKRSQPATPDNLLVFFQDQGAAGGDAADAGQEIVEVSL